MSLSWVDYASGGKPPAFSGQQIQDRQLETLAYLKINQHKITLYDLLPGHTINMLFIMPSLKVATNTCGVLLFFFSLVKKWNNILYQNINYLY